MGIHVPPCTVQTGRGYGSRQPQLLSSFCRRGLPLWTLPRDGGSSNIPWTVKAFITASSRKTPASRRRVKLWRQTWPSDVLLCVLLVRGCLTILMEASCPHPQSPDSLLAHRECERNAATSQSWEMSYDHNVINPRSFGASLRC